MPNCCRRCTHIPPGYLILKKYVRTEQLFILQLSNLIEELRENNKRLEKENKDLRELQSKESTPSRDGLSFESGSLFSIIVAQI